MTAAFLFWLVSNVFSSKISSDSLSPSHLLQVEPPLVAVLNLQKLPTSEPCKRKTINHNWNVTLINVSRLIVRKVYIAWFALLVTVQRTAGQKGICNPRSSQHRGDGRTEMICDTVTGKWTVWDTASVPRRKGARPRPNSSPSVGTRDMHDSSPVSSQGEK